MEKNASQEDVDSEDKAYPKKLKIMKTDFDIKNKFQDNHWSFKSTAAGQADLRSSELQVFLSCLVLNPLGRVQVFSFVRCFHINMVHTIVVRRTEVHLRHESSNEH